LFAEKTSGTIAPLRTDKSDAERRRLQALLGEELQKQREAGEEA
jgi:hypothetical protein